MDTTWIKPGDPPFCGIHETGDGVVPCYTEQAYALGFPTGIVVSGDHDVTVRMGNIGVPRCYLEYGGNGHVGYLEYDKDNALEFVASFLADVVCDAPLSCGVSTGVAEETVKPTALPLHPVPARDRITLDLDEISAVTIMDGQGRLVWEGQLAAGPNSLDVSTWPNGLYLVRSLGQVVRTGRIVVSR